MGELIFFSDFRSYRNDAPAKRDDAQWYFLDYRGGRTHDINPAVTYPHPVYLHKNLLSTEYNKDDGGNAERRITIRRWIERNVDGPVLMVYENMSYYRVYNMSLPKEERHKTSIDHGYYVFRFEEANDALAFRMAHAHTLAKPVDHHPEYPPYRDAQDFKNGHEADALVPWRGYI